jgi:sensor histidine kinase YesM
LNAIINIADGISKGADGQVNENQKASLSMIAASGKRLANLINDILDFAKLKNNELKMNFEPVNLKRIVENVISVTRRLNPSGSVRIFSDIPEEIPNIYADENRLLQILYNLLGNALKFTEKGYVKVSARRLGDRNTIEICVEDTGIGIPEDNLGNIFVPFQQLEASLTRRYGGTGLGLPITKYLVEAHGGKMRVESKDGQGAKFFFSIPSSEDNIEEKSMPGAMSETACSEVHIEKFPLRHKADGSLVVVVDDNEANLMSLVGIFKMNNYSVTAVTSSKEFFMEFEEFKRENNVSLVILDVMMPGLSGYDICREIRKSLSVSELPVLMLTAKASIHDIVMGMESGANDYLTKPFETDELLARVKTLIQLKESVDKARLTEMAFLQAQIKPHFLYNALNTFVSISRYDMDKARDLIIEFGNYLRRSFDFRDLTQLVPLKNELELVRAYIQIEKARFEERLEVIFDVPEDLEVSIPMLILQPIIENAIIHGILPNPEGGNVYISIRKEEKALHVMVKDDGAGMDEGRLEDVLADDRNTGIGLYNIEKRLRRLYGRGLEIKSKPGGGTEVNLCIPMK